MPPEKGYVYLGELEVFGLAAVTTESSMWLITERTYRRLPRDERQRPTDYSPWGRLDDLVEHQHHGGHWWWVPKTGSVRLQLLAVEGPEDGLGVVTGRVVSVQGAQWMQPGLAAVEERLAAHRPCTAAEPVQGRDAIDDEVRVTGGESDET